jgi:hypothetical protein
VNSDTPELRLLGGSVEANDARVGGLLTPVAGVQGERELEQHALPTVLSYRKIPGMPSDCILIPCVPLSDI